MLFGQRQFAVKIILFSSLLAFVSPCCAWSLSFDAESQGLAHYIMAVCHDLNGESAQAIGDYQQSVKFNGLELAPRLKLGAYYLRLDEPRKAAIQFKEVARLSPQNSQAHYLLALIYSSEQQFDLAASEYETILKNTAHDDPANTSALCLLGSVYADNNEHVKAIGIFRRVLHIEPENAEALNSLGYIYAEDGTHLDEAFRMVQKATAIDPANGAYYDSLGWVLYKKGKYAESLMALQKSQTYIEDEILYDHLGDVFKALKEYALACKYWQKSLDLDPHQILVQQKIKENKK
jgi:Tfp pilus assembly protein PilF